MTDTDASKYVNKILVATRLQTYLLTVQLASEESEEKRLVIFKDLVKLSKYIAHCASKINIKEQLSTTESTDRTTLQAPQTPQHVEQPIRERTNGFDKLVNKLLSPSKIPEEQPKLQMPLSPSPTFPNIVDNSLQQVISSVEDWSVVREYIHNETSCNQSSDRFTELPPDKSPESPPPPPPASPPESPDTSPRDTPASQSLIYFSPGGDHSPPALRVPDGTSEIQVDRRQSPIFYSKQPKDNTQNSTNSSASSPSVPPNKLNLRQSWSLAQK